MATYTVHSLFAWHALSNHEDHSFYFLGALAGKQYFINRPRLCTVIASLCLTACFCAMFNLLAVTFQRYMYMCHSKKCKDLFTRKKCIILCIVIWIAAFLCEIGNFEFIGWGGHTFDITVASCIWDRTVSKSYTIFVSGVLIVASLLLIAFFHLKIFLLVRKHHIQVTATGTNQACVDSSRKMMLNTCKSIFIVFCAFVIAWVPYSVVIVVDFYKTLPAEVHLWVTWLAHTHAAVNWIIFTINYSRFRQALFSGLKAIRYKIQSNNSKTSTESHSKDFATTLDPNGGPRSPYAAESTQTSHLKADSVHKY